MIKSETVFVVGAGASTEAGLPTSDRLTNKIAKIVPIANKRDTSLTDGDKKVHQALLHHVGRAHLGPYYNAGRQIADAMPQAASIDSFIESRKDSKEIEICGKLAIVKSILDSERKSLLYVDFYTGGAKLNFARVEETWYGRFWKLLVDGIDENAVDDIFHYVSFVIFNYDRCIEHYLFHSIQNYYGFDADKAAVIMKSLRIFHPYGQVGTLPWQKRGGTTAYGENDVHPIELLTLSGEVKTYTEQTEGDKELVAMRQLMGSAERVVFLGFGFHLQNMELIQPTKPHRIGRVYATTFETSESERILFQNDIKSMFRRSENNFDGQVKIGNGHLSCYDLFKEYGVSFSRA